MQTTEAIAEAKARITWGEDPKSVRHFLTSTGMSAAEADAQVGELLRERNSDVRKLGIRNILIGSVLILVSAGGSYLTLYGHSNGSLTYRTGRGFGFLILIGFYGLWQLVNGAFRLTRPKAEHKSLSDIS